MAKKNTTPPAVDTQRAPVPLVAIGASAGGLEAVTELLQHLSPNTGLAFVYIQHLDPTHDSHLAAILGRATTMPVVEANHLVVVEPNHVYVIPPDRDMESVEGILTLTARKRAAGSDRPPIHMPIDQFFISLADRQKEAAIGVVLSGMASDGTLGLRAIKAAGGITFAQDDSARFQSMPRSAIAEGVVDRVLPPAEIARELEQLSHMTELFHQTGLTEDQELISDEEDLKTILGVLRRAVGVDFTHYKMTTIRRRIVRRMLLYRLETLKDYSRYLRQNADEIGMLYSDLLINVTTFFRDEDTMDHLKKVLLPRIIQGKTARESLRIWVPACSTGQEAYSIAMLLLEILGSQASRMTIQIFATDLSETAVAKARLGTYTQGEVVDVSPKRLQRFFTRVDDHYRINKAVRDLCVFAPHNVLRDPPFSRLDLISCRNLLIYLDTVFQRRATATFHYALNPNGYLVLGKSESVGGATPLFLQIEKNHKIFARKNDIPSRVSFDLHSRSGAGTEPANGSSAERSAGRDEGQPASESSAGKLLRVVNDLEKTVNDLLLRQYVPASVVVNQDLDILQFRGSTGLFLEPAPGKASLNLLKMARPSLAFEIRNTIHKVRKTGQPVRKTNLEVKLKDKTHYVAIEAVPLDVSAEERLFLILFEEIMPTPASGVDANDSRNRRIKQLEDELATLREDMRSIIEAQEASNEELQSANEEIISSNEELQSINEELETSKEEIESTNEELLTINQELQVRNDQLSEANDFSEVILSTINEATLVLDEDLRVRSANKTFYRLFQMSDDEVIGRLIYELGDRQWDIPQLRLLLTDVITHNVQVDGFEMNHTFANIGEKMLRLNARRVIRQQESILLAIEDITEHRRAQRLTAEREAWMHTLVNNAPVLIWVANRHGKYNFFNEAWLQYTGRSLEEATTFGWEQDIHPDDRESYLSTFNMAFAKREPFQAEFRLKRYDSEYHWMLVNAKPTYTPGVDAPGVDAPGVDAPGVDAPGIFDGYIGTCAQIYNRKTLLQALDLRAQQRTQQVVDASARLIRARRELAQTEVQLAQRSALSADHASGSSFNLSEVYQQAQRKLRMSEERLRMLIDNTPDVITRWNRDLKLIYANPAFEAKTGVPNEQLLGMTNAEMGQPDEIARPYMDKLRLVLQTGSSQSHYNSFPTPRGIAYYYSSMMPEFETDGSVQSVLVIARDITDLKLVEEIQVTANNLQAVLNTSPAFIGLLRAVRDQHYQVVDFQLAVCNQKLADLVGRPIDQLIGQYLPQLANAFWGEETFGQLTNVLTTGEPIYRESRTEHEGRERWLGISVAQHDGGLVVSGLDITALKQAEQQRAAYLQQIHQSQTAIQALEDMRRQIRERGEFLRATTHDLRGSFGVVQGAAALLNLSDTDEERTEMLSMLQRNLRQMTQMLSQLLDYSRLEAGQEIVENAPFDAAGLLQELTFSLQPMADERTLWLRTDGAAKLPVVGDSVKVHRIAQNLLLNALHNTPTGGVTVGWAIDPNAPENWAFYVADTGPGLSPGLVAQLTDAGDAEVTGTPGTQHRRAAGEGIGLFIVKRLVVLLEGSLTIETRPGEGTRFRISLPQPKVS